MDRFVTVRPKASPGWRSFQSVVPKKLFMAERWLSVEEIAAHLGVNRDTIYKWIERKKMPCHKAGRLWKFLASEIDLWVKGGHAAKDIAPRKPVLARKRKVNRA